jgi:signal transduction histidine kinase/ActR/RegA family two-component response regulator
LSSVDLNLAARMRRPRRWQEPKAAVRFFTASGRNVLARVAAAGAAVIGAAPFFGVWIPLTWMAAVIGSQFISARLATKVQNRSGSNGAAPFALIAASMATGVLYGIGGLALWFTGNDAAQLLSIVLLGVATTYVLMQYYADAQMMVAIGSPYGVTALVIGGDLTIRNAHAGHPWIILAVVGGALSASNFVYNASRQLAGSRTLLRQAKALAQEREHAAQEANKAKSNFLAMMSHELRTPMNGVLGMAHALSASPLSVKQREQIETLIRSGDGLMQVLNDVLDISKIEAGKFEISREDFDLNDLVERACDLWIETAREKRLGFEHRIDPATPAWISGDALRIRQVLNNLLSNAIKFTDEGEVRLDVRVLAPGDQTPRLEFVVSDTGPGLSEECQGRLFRAFSQADAAVARTHGGTGLGLSICRQLARLMGGDVSVESRLGEGSRFKLVLPLAEAAGPAAVEDDGEAGDIDGLSILVVDDNPTNQAVVKALLEATGSEIATADNGQQALDALAARDFDLVLMDVHMPVMDGIEATRRIRAGEAGAADTPILALTADAMSGERERLLSLGFDSFIAKPIQPRELITQLSAWSGKRSAHGVLQAVA